MAFSRLTLVLVLLFSGLYPSDARAAPGERWQYEWPKTDFTITSVDLDDIFSGGPPKDGLPSLHAPTFAPFADLQLSDS